MKPTVGRIVHYVSYGTPGREYKSECRAAIVTEVYARGPEETAVGLCVLNPTGQFFNRYVARDDGGMNNPAITDKVQPVLCGGLTYTGGTWHWPEREEI